MRQEKDPPFLGKFGLRSPFSAGPAVSPVTLLHTPSVRPPSPLLSSLLFSQYAARLRFHASLVRSVARSVGPSLSNRPCFNKHNSYLHATWVHLKTIRKASCGQRAYSHGNPRAGGAADLRCANNTAAAAAAAGAKLLQGPRGRRRAGPLSRIQRAPFDNGCETCDAW